MNHEPSACNLLIVDDDEAIGSTLLAILRKSGYHGSWVSTGRSAIGFARDYEGSGHRLNLALIDLRLPDMSGLEVLREIKKMHPDVGAIMMTGFADVTTAVGALNEGAFAYIQKPYNIDEVKVTMERALERQSLLWENRALLGRLREANADLINTIDNLQEMDKVRSEFVHIVSHEMRSPLTVIIGYSEMLLENRTHMTEDRIQKSLESISCDGHRLTRLTEDLLNLAKSQEKKFAVSPVKLDLKQVAAKVIEDFKVLNTRMAFELAFEEGAGEVVSDRDRIEQVLVNLVGNAIKYSPPDGKVLIAARKDGSNTRVSVTDQGPGITESEQSKIFEAFYRIQADIDKKTKGTGLGLTITKAIVESLGGKISVASGPGGKGSSFNFVIPGLSS